VKQAEGVLHWLVAFDRTSADDPHLLYRVGSLVSPAPSRARQLASANLPHTSSSTPTALVRGALTDLTYTKAELIVENALLRHQLGLLQRQVKRPQLNRRVRFWLLVLASRIHNWKDALLIIQPKTLLRWHRAGFRLFWQWKSNAKLMPPALATETITLIQQMASENLTRGAERIRGELLKLEIRVAKRTIQKYLRGVRQVSAPTQAWRTLLKNHADEM
jgi:putative transposase